MLTKSNEGYRFIGYYCHHKAVDTTKIFKCICGILVRDILSAVHPVDSLRQISRVVKHAGVTELCWEQLFHVTKDTGLLTMEFRSTVKKKPMSTCRFGGCFRN